MTNQSIYAAFERMWQHINVLFGKKQDKFATMTSDDSGTTLTTENNLFINAPAGFAIESSNIIDLTSNGECIYLVSTNGYIDITSENNNINMAAQNINFNLEDGFNVNSNGEILLNAGDYAVDIQTADEIYVNGNAGTYISNIATPTNERDAANKLYVDNTIKSFLVVSSTQPDASEYPEGALWIQPQV